MKAVFPLLRDTFRDVWSDLWTMLAVNFFWLLANLLIVPGPPATLALLFYANRIAHGEVAGLEDFWNVFRRQWGVAWRWGGINAGVVLFLVADITLTGQFQGAWVPYLQGFYIAVLAGWLALQFFALPFLFEQEKMSVRRALRNGWVLMGNNPGFAVLLVVCLVLILIVFTVTFLLSLMLGAAFLACASNRAVLDRLERVERGDSGRLNGTGRKS